MTKKGNIKKMKAVFYSVFKNNNLFGRMFNDCIKKKIVLYPTDGYYLKREQFEGLKEAVRSFGELEFYASMIENNNFHEIFEITDSYLGNHWIFNSETSYEEYKDTPIVLENALYSKIGKWGIVISHEDHAVAGGSERFIQLFKKSYKEWGFGLNNFVEMCKYNEKHYNSDLTWLSNFLDYINKS